MKIYPAIALFAVLLLSGGEVWSFTIKTSDEGTLLQWPPGRTAIFYRVGSQGVGARPETVEAVARAFQSWETRSRGEVVFIYAGFLEGVEAARDGANTLLWIGEDWKYGAEIVALATVWSSDESGEIEEVDIEFNSRDYDWTSSVSPGIQEIALHEIGHLLGIDHSFNPGAVMYDIVGPYIPAKRALSRDDIEAIMFLYPRTIRTVNRYDLPVLFYPRDFPEESPFLPPAAVPEPGPGRWLTALGMVDFDGDGYRSELLVGWRDDRGRKVLEGWGMMDDVTGRLRRLGSPVEIPPDGEINGVTGLDIDRDGICGEAAVLIRNGEGERLYFYGLESGADPAFDPIASLVVAAPPAGNLIGMAALDADGDRLRDELLLLRAVEDGFSLYLHGAPPAGEEIDEPDPGVEISVPGLQEGSCLLGLAVLDADGDGEERDPVFLELTASGEYWLHAFRLIGQAGAAGYEIAYLTSALLPNEVSNVLPSRITGLDANRDGYFNELIIFATQK